jgi:hypothetical protein
MNLETGWQRVAVLALSLAFVAVLVNAAAVVLESLNDEHREAVGQWARDHWDSFKTFLLAAVPAVATYLFGRRAGRKSGKTESYSTAITTVENTDDPAAAAQTLRTQAKDHGLRVTA